MNLMNQYFDKIYVTTIDKHIVRRQSISERIHFLDFEYFDKVDITRKDFTQFPYVKDFPDIFFESLNLSKEYASRWSKGQLGCFANVIRLYKDALQNNYSKILVLEDDVILDNKTFEIFEKVLLELPADWDLLFLGYKKSTYQKRFWRPFKRLYHSFKGNDHKSIVPVTFSKHLDKLPERFSGGFAYALTLHGIKKILAHKSPIEEFGDVLFPLISKQPGFKAFVVYPQIANEVEFESSTQKNW